MYSLILRAAPNFHSTKAAVRDYSGHHYNIVKRRLVLYAFLHTVYKPDRPVDLACLVYGDVVLPDCLMQPVFVKSYPFGQE